MTIKFGIETRLVRLDLIKKALIESAIVVHNDAKLLCPVDTGRLRGSISFALQDIAPVVEGPADQSEAITPPTESLVAKVGTNVKYAIFVEYMQGNKFAFLRRAFIQNFSNIKDTFGEALKKSVGE